MSDRRLDYIELLWQEVSRNPHRLLDVEKEEEQEEAPPPRRTLQALCSIPRRLAISAGLGGTPVTPQLIESLRRILLGGNFRVFDYEWRKAVFHFREPNSEFAYALKADGGGARAIQMVVQARIIKHLLFTQQSTSDGQTLHSLTEVGRREQDRALAAALSDSLWLAGQEASATVTLVTEDYCITSHLDNKLDTFTERVPPFLTALRPLLRPQHLVTSVLSCLSAAALHVQREGRHHQLHPRPHPVLSGGGQSWRHPFPLQPHLLPYHREAEAGPRLSYVIPAAPQPGQLCLSAGSAEPTTDRQSQPAPLQRDAALRAGRPASAAPPAGRPVPQRCRISALESRGDGARCAAAGGQHAEDPQVPGVGLQHQQQLLGPVQRHTLAAVRLEGGASVPAVLLLWAELADSDGQADSRYSLPPLGGVVQRWRRSRETVSLTGDDHQDQVGRSCDRLERHLPLLLNITTNTGLRSSQHSRLFLPL
ncbi:uncharacterized protein mindy4b isoform X3 [Astatotilapia calliptera]|uniref:uncharacterized protein mindy4b isoform X3 n=1 Tax=Astatotilapia calliptera TaxID=8154 RepID=UPI000E4243CF|nr:uncharacterized protein LOC113036305 isoform X3 [Astatotilapia calliptera]